MILRRSRRIRRRFLELVVPTALRLCDANDVPVLSGLLYPYLLLPIVGFFSALSLGKRQGLCILYPLSCVAFTALFILTARLYSNMADGSLLLIALLSTLFGNLLGVGIKAWKRVG